MGAEANLSHLVLIKTQTGWANADTETVEFHQKIKLGEAIHADFKRFRNINFHRKLFALLSLSYDYWVPGEVNSKYGIPEKNFDRFRKDLIILAGYYHSEIRLDGTVRVTADSISFGNMDEETFSKLYDNILTVIMDRIPTLCDMKRNKIDDLVEKVLTFA